MKSIKRILLGLISSLLLAVGFVRAAENADPMNRAENSVINADTVSEAGEPCGPCDVDEAR